MIYTFHVGDYVRLERADGTSSKTLTGYVSSHQRLVSGYSFIFKWDDGTQMGWSGNIEDLPENFTRIGKYDFAWLRAVRDCGYAEKDEVDKMSFTKTMMLPGNLHEGDFVETVDGRVGYIKSICRCEKCRERGFYEPIVHFTDGEEDCITKYEAENGFKGYKRIGRWENPDAPSASKKRRKIERIHEVVGAGDITFFKLDTTNEETTRTRVNVSEIQRKVNELVDAVNELKEGKQK